MDVNYAECIKESTHLGYTIYHNVCSATSVRVYWGTLDWVMMSIFLIFVFLLLSFVLGAALFFLHNEVIRPWRRQREYNKLYSNSK